MIIKKFKKEYYFTCKMVKTRLVVFFAFAILSMGFLSAVTTTVNVHAPVNFTVNAFFTDPSTNAYSVIEMMNEDTGSNGLAVLTLDTSKSEFELKLNLRKDGETHYSEDFGVFPTGGIIDLDFYPRWSPKPEVVGETESVNESSEEIVNETIEEIVEVDNETGINETSSEKLTAHSISDSAFFKGNNIFYYVGGLIVLAALIILFFKYRKYRKHNPREPKKVKVVKLSEMKEIQEKSNDSIKEQEEKIEAAKKMIEEAEGQIKKMKNQNNDKIEAAKRKLIEDQKELMRLREEAKKEDEE